MPHGFARPAAVWLTTLRNRRHYLGRITAEDYQSYGRRYRLGADNTPQHLCGLPIYYMIQEQRLFLWPVPLHDWTGTVSKEEADQWPNPSAPKFFR